MGLEEKKAAKLQNSFSPSYTSSSNYGKIPKHENPHLQSLGTPHVESFNYLIDHGLKAAVADLVPHEFQLPSGEKIKISIDEATLHQPVAPKEAVGIKYKEIWPTECRQRAATYRGDFTIKITFKVDNKSLTLEKSLGKFPIMVKSKLCHLADLTPEEMVKHNEHVDDWGGYFIVKGHERLIRMLQATRRNFPVAIKRPTWKARGDLFSDLGVLVRCVTEDQTSTNNVLHFVQNGTCKFMFSHSKTMYYVPLMLIIKCIDSSPEFYLYRLFLNGKSHDLYYVNCIENMFRALHEENLHTSQQCRVYMGRLFRHKMYDLPPWTTDEEITDYLMKRCVLIHLPKYEDKLHALVYMTQKLFDLVQNKCKVEGADAIMMQELQIGGYVYLQVLKECMQSYTLYLRRYVIKNASAGVPLNADFFQKIVRRLGLLENKMESFISTGNVPSTNVNLTQYKGLTILAENINRMRYMSHFKAIHRGSFFMTMRTTEARQLLPDAWGFVCPVHTPDGAPCGLLNHLTMDVTVTTHPDKKSAKDIEILMHDYGMQEVSRVGHRHLDNDKYLYPVFVDGKQIGFYPPHKVEQLVLFLRTLKIKGDRIPKTTEIVLIPKTKMCSQYPGLFFFTTECRMMRPVYNLYARDVELIGTLEQVYLDVAVTRAEIHKDKTTHLELSKSSFLSNLAKLIPMPDCNQSPRNMYQCQMAKQTMGTPIHTWGTNAETKLYRLQTPATPLFRPTHHNVIGMDDYPAGTNALVAVISYTGYDMEDAMIINKSSYERGLCAGSVYKSNVIDLPNTASYFCRDESKPELAEYMDSDGLPPVGARVKHDDPFYCYFDGNDNKYVMRKYLGTEEAYVDSVRQCVDFAKTPKKAIVMLRIQRNPTVGDKFASRAGQKGILSQLWPSEDLPFTEIGMVPDILFNPHGFPSRMTIAMMIEIMAGKAGAVHSHVHDATPFRFNEKDTAIDYFGRLLEAGGYNYFGTERMYSGVDGRELTADIFFGVVHYQRLRHMVSDKWQVRTTGAVDSLTRQPLKGRRRGGGVRLGEMERDALLSHGASFLLQDRLLHCSDETDAILCNKCGTLLGPISGKLDGLKDSCRLCGSGCLVSISIPYIFKFFVTQLAAVNINIKIKCVDGKVIVDS